MINTQRWKGERGERNMDGGERETRRGRGRGRARGRGRE